MDEMDDPAVDVQVQTESKARKLALHLEIASGEAASPTRRLTLIDKSQ